MSEAGPQEREEQLAVLRRRMGRALRRGDDARLRALAVVYEAAKAAHAESSLEEHKAAVRAARAQQEQVPERRGRVPWSRARFGRSPGAVERDRQPRLPEPLQPPASGHLSPWRRSGHPGSEVIWRM